MIKPYFIISFGEHVSDDSKNSILSSIDAYGIIKDTETSSKVKVEVIKSSKINDLKKQLVSFERNGTIKWEIIEI